MSNNEDNFLWARRLECPTSAITEAIKKSLHQGISGLLWDELAGTLCPAKEVLEVRKNILLHKLKHGEKDLSLQHLQNIVKLREARALLDPEIEVLEEKCKKQDFVARQNQQKLRKIKSQRHWLRIKENLLRLKLNELKSQIEDGKQMRSVCQHLMPANNCHINPDVVNESLSLVSTISTRADRKMVLNRISENLGAIDVPTLWNVLLARRTEDTEDLMELGTREIVDKNIETSENMDISISRSHARYIVTSIQEHIYYAKNSAHEKQVMEYIEKIEASEADSIHVSEWLALTLEVRMLETEQKCLETEIDLLKKTLEQQFSLDDELSNLETEILGIHTKMENCMQDIQKSLVLLKPAGSEIARTREKLIAVLQRILALREEKQKTDYLNIDPATELHAFHDTVQLEALNKIVLKDKVGAYRHSKFCISEALETVTAPLSANDTSEFPMIRAPLYHLLNCYKLLTTASWLTKLESESNTNERYDLGEWKSPIAQDSSDDCIEILNVTDSSCDRVRNEIVLFNSIFDAWKYQTVQKVLALDDRIVKGATFKEWVKRYDMMLHMIRKIK